MEVRREKKREEKRREEGKMVQIVVPPYNIVTHQSSLLL